MESPEPFERGDLSIDFVQQRVGVAGEEVMLTATQYNLLAELAINAGRMVTHEELLHRVWGPTNPGSPRVIRTQLMRAAAEAGGGRREPDIHLRRTPGRV